MAPKKPEILEGFSSESMLSQLDALNSIPRKDREDAKKLIPTLSALQIRAFCDLEHKDRSLESLQKMSKLSESQAENFSKLAKSERSVAAIDKMLGQKKKVPKAVIAELKQESEQRSSGGGMLSFLSGLVRGKKSNDKGGRDVG